MSRNIIGIDIGGTKTNIGLIRDAEVIKEIVYNTAASGSKEIIITDLIRGIEHVAGSDFCGIGIGVPGLVDEQKGIVYDLLNIPSWKEVHLKKELEDHFGKPVEITNDANVFVLGEKVFGEGTEFRNLVGVTLGTGFGTGIIIDNKMYSGTLSSAGELGDIPYLDKTIEDYCSGKFFNGQYNIDGGTVFKLAEEGDVWALSIFEEYGVHLGNAMKLVINVLSPEAIFFGGSVSRGFNFFEASLLEQVASVSFKRVTNQLVMKKSAVGKISLLGAAALFKNGQLQKEEVSDIK